MTCKKMTFKPALYCDCCCCFRELDVRVMNDKVMQVSRAFIHVPGLLGRPQVRSVATKISISGSHAGYLSF